MRAYDSDGAGLAYGRSNASGGAESSLADRGCLSYGIAGGQRTHAPFDRV